MTESSRVPEADVPQRRDDLPASLHAVRARFVDLILPRLVTLEGLRADLASSSDSHAALAGIGSLCHKIAGVAATLGFPHAGDLAGEIDAAIDAGLAAGGTADVVWRQIDPALEALMDELESTLDA